ncbi:hypothetical protein C4375_01295 [Devosia sp. I507]|jgi:hypothetical protein|nr:hypothetical protein C4375_01295 [Devosia sp. I507]
MLSRAKALSSIEVGDVIFGIAEGGQPKLLLVYEADSRGFSARHVTSQTTAKFGRDGKSTWVAGGGSCVIVSTARLPSDMYETALGLDRKWATKPEYPDTILSQAEIKLMTSHRAFFEARPLPVA